MKHPYVPTTEEIIEHINQCKFPFEPYALICNSANKDLFEKEFGDRFKIIDSPMNELNTVYVIDKTQYNRIKGE